MNVRSVIVLTLLFVSLLSTCGAAAPTQFAPDFSLGDRHGKAERLASFHGRPIVLWFFCGCPWCRDCARQWGLLQQGGVLEAGPTAPVTLIVFSGSATEGRTFASDAGMDVSHTVIVSDPQLEVTDKLYHASPCPRVFVLDGSRAVRYTNDHGGDRPRVASAALIVDKALTALREIKTPQAASK